MKTRIIVATGTAVAAGLIGAGGASALVGVNLATPTTSTTTASAGGNGADNGIHDTRKQQSAPCVDALGQEQGTFTYDGPEYVWPPNHKYRNVAITLTDTDEEAVTDDATVAVMGTHDQILADGSEMNGAGNTDPATDVVPGAPGAGNPTAATSVQFRGERSGRVKAGRTYTFTVTGTTDSGLSECDPVTFTAFVPHDQRNHTNSGPKKSSSSKALARKRAKRLALKRAR